jgi:hypothetical protein
VGSVEAKFVDETALSWEKHYGRILEPFKSGLYPSSLNFTGWTFRCQLGWKMEDEGWFRLPTPKTEGFCKLGHAWPFRSQIARLSSIARIDPFYTEDGELNFLVIEEQEDRHLFERLESCHLNNEGDVLLTMEAGRGLWGGIELDWKYICLV